MHQKLGEPRRASPAAAARAPGADAARDDVRLIGGVQDGSAESMNDLLKKYWPSVVEYAARYTEHRDAAEDIAQELFLRLWQKKLSWKQQGSLRSFLYGVARNLARNSGRRWREVRLTSLEAAEADVIESTCPLDAVIERDLEACYQQAVSTLPARRQEIFTLARVHGLSYQEIADVMSISPQTVANQMSGALAHLRHTLRPVLDL